MSRGPRDGCLVDRQSPNLFYRMFNASIFYLLGLSIPGARMILYGASFITSMTIVGHCHHMPIEQEIWGCCIAFDRF